jgi:hypothetical protein
MTKTRATDRPSRTPLGAKNRMTFADKDPAYRYRFINDKDDRLDRAQAAGYDFVISDEPVGDKRVAEASKMGTKVSKAVGGGLVAYLMRIPVAFYEEDQQAKEAALKDVEKTLKPDKSKNQYGEGLTNE